MVKCNLSRILGERRMTRVELARQTGLTYQGIKPLYDDTWKGVQRNTIDVICRALGVQLGELFEYVPDQPKLRKGGK